MTELHGADLENSQKLRPKRLNFVFGVLTTFFSLFVLRALFLALSPMPFGGNLKTDEDSHSRYSKEVRLSPYRGNIYDHKGEPLAISVKRLSLAINPRVFDPNHLEITQLAKFLRIKKSYIKKMSKRQSYFSWLKRKVSDQQGERVLSMNLAGLYSIKEPARVYPILEKAGHLVGAVGVDNNGLFGLEKEFDQHLSGLPSVVKPTVDARGRLIFDQEALVQPHRSGNHVTLTIDRVIQEVAYEELARGVKDAKAKSGFVIIADPHSGRILAVANFPGFDVQKKETRNRALVDLFEPGSIIKPFVIAKALQLGVVKKDSVFDCEEGHMRVGRNTIHDTHARSHLTVAETLIHSSNICTFKIASKLGEKRTFEALQSFGITTKAVQLPFPGQITGSILPYQKWKAIRFANISFGQGFLTSALEIVQAMGVIANGGRWIAPSLVSKITSSDGLIVRTESRPVTRPVLDERVAKEVAQILSQVVEKDEGTGKRARLTQYTVAGKTGTAQKVDFGVKGYAKDRYLVSFIGYAPVSDPHFVAIVALDEPKVKPYYGGMWAAPVFGRIAERVLKYLNVEPDKPLEPKVQVTGI